jgi:hypothetical protein
LLSQDLFKGAGVVIRVAKSVNRRDLVPQRAVKNFATLIGIKLGYFGGLLTFQQTAAKNAAC